MAKFTGHTITPDSALGGIQLEKSLRFDDNQSSPTRLTRTIQSGGNRKKFTLSVWVKRSQLGNTAYSNDLGQDGQTILHTVGGSNRGWIKFNTDDTLGFDQGDDSQGRGIIDTVAKYRDVTSWYHLVFVADYANGTAADRAKIYVNGVQQEVSTTRSFDNVDGKLNDNQIHEIGHTEYGQGYTGSNNRFNFFCGYMAEYHFVDGQSYDPTYFGYTDAHTGQWRPKKYEGTHGTTGWYLPFTDNSSTAALGYDKSGLVNTWTTSGFSVSAGSDNDSMLDIPTNNWCVWNGVTDVSDITINDGNLQAISGADSWPAIFGTHGASSGKWYYEAVGADNTRWGVGWSTEDFKSGTSNTFSVGHFAYSQDPLTLYQDGTNVAINGTPAFTTGNVLQIATDIDNGKTWFGINNTWVNASNGSAGDPAAGTNPTITFSEKGQKHYPKLINNLGNVSVNFGQQGFTYTPPDGFQALNSKNLATVNAAGIINPKKHFDILIWDGDSSHNRNITGLEFKPDMVWIKSRNGGTYGGGLYYHHVIWDVLRGVGSDTVGASSRKELTVNENYQEGRGANYTDYYGHVSSFNRDGFQLDHVTGEPPLYVNRNTNTYVAWCWKAGGAGVSNSDGDITTTVSVNQEAGFSMFTYTGNGGNGQTVGHGLSKAPQWIIVKNRSNAQNWRVWHHKLAADGSKRLILDQTNVVEDAAFLNDTAPTSTVFTLGPVDDAWNANGDNYISYCWHEVPGYSKFGSYTGNGSSEGVYVNIGFKPAWLLVKDTSTTENWRLFDNKRSPSNQVNKHLFPSNPNAESTETGLDFLSNGFKFRDGDAHQNGNGNVYVYMAFAEKPSGTMFGLDANGR